MDNFALEAAIMDGKIKPLNKKQFMIAVKRRFVAKAKRKRRRNSKREPRAPEAPLWTLHGPRGTIYYIDAAKMCGIPKSTLGGWMSKGLIPAISEKRRRGNGVYMCKYVLLKDVRERCRKLGLGEWKIKRRFIGKDEYAILSEVRDVTGFSSGAIFSWRKTKRVRATKIDGEGQWWYNLADCIEHAAERRGKAKWQRRTE
jgi:hypothetical protein